MPIFASSRATFTFRGNFLGRQISYDVAAVQPIRARLVNVAGMRVDRHVLTSFMLENAFTSKKGRRGKLEETGRKSSCAFRGEGRGGVDY